MPPAHRLVFLSTFPFFPMLSMSTAAVRRLWVSLSPHWLKQTTINSWLLCGHCFNHRVDISRARHRISTIERTKIIRSSSGLSVIKNNNNIIILSLRMSLGVPTVLYDSARTSGDLKISPSEFRDECRVCFQKADAAYTYISVYTYTSIRYMVCDERGNTATAINYTFYVRISAKRIAIKWTRDISVRARGEIAAARTKKTFRFAPAAAAAAV